MREVTVPRLNANDDAYVLTHWLVPEGTLVEAGVAVVELETSKATSELEAQEQGYLQHLLPVGAQICPGDVVARLHDDADASRSAPAASSPPEGPSGGVTITRPARRLMAEHGLTEGLVLNLGKAVVKSEDIQALIEASTGGAWAGASDGTSVPTAPGKPLVMSRNQLAVARVVSVSAATIPAAFTAVKVNAESLSAHQRVLVERGEGMVGHPEFVVVALTHVIERHEVFAAAVVGDQAFLPEEPPVIGVTLDVGTGLFVVAVPSSRDTTAPAVSSHLLRRRIQALRGSLSEGDLGAPRLILTLHTAQKVTLAVPLIFPGQVCALSVCALDEEAVALADGRVMMRPVFSLGVAFDHRFINGAQAAAFLGDLRAELESTMWKTPDDAA